MAVNNVIAFTGTHRSSPRNVCPINGALDRDRELAREIRRIQGREVRHACRTDVYGKCWRVSRDGEDIMAHLGVLGWWPAKDIIPWPENAA